MSLPANPFKTLRVNTGSDWCYIHRIIMLVQVTPNNGSDLATILTNPFLVDTDKGSFKTLFHSPLVVSLPAQPGVNLVEVFADNIIECQHWFQLLVPSTVDTRYIRSLTAHTLHVNSIKS